MTTKELSNTFDSMQRNGGGFCRLLAQAWCKADVANKVRIEKAFPHLLEDYGPGSAFYEEWI